MGYNSNMTGAEVVAALNKANSSVQAIRVNNATYQPSSGVVDLGAIGGGPSEWIELDDAMAELQISPNKVYYWPLNNSTTPRTLYLTAGAAGDEYRIIIRIDANKPDSINIVPPEGRYWLHKGEMPDFATLSAYDFVIKCIAEDVYTIDYTEILGRKQNRGDYVNFSVMDWNIKTSLGVEEHPWSQRKSNVIGFMFGQISDSNGYTAPAPDIIGLQEIYQYGDQWDDIFDYINSNTPAGKTYSGLIAYRGDTILLDSEGCAIIYNTNKFDLVDNGKFWLRGGDGFPESPYEEGIASWQASTSDNVIVKRIAIWAILRDKVSGKEVFVLNTHYNPSAAGTVTMQYYSSELIKKMVNTLNGGRPTIFMGDLNCNPDTSPIRILEPTYDLFQSTRDDARLLFGDDYTVNDWSVADDSLAIFDYIFTKGEFKVNTLTVSGARTITGGYLSDHNALIADIYMK